MTRLREAISDRWQPAMIFATAVIVVLILAGVVRVAITGEDTNTLLTGQDADRARSECVTAYRSSADSAGLELLAATSDLVRFLVRHPDGGSPERLGELLDGLDDRLADVVVVVDQNSRVNALCDPDRPGGPDLPGPDE